PAQAAEANVSVATIARAFCNFVQLATARLRSRPPKGVRKNARLSTGCGGGGQGWGVARTGQHSAVPWARIHEPQETAAEASEIGLARRRVGPGNFTPSLSQIRT